MNDVEIEADEDGLVELTLSVATGETGKSEIAEYFRARAHPPAAGTNCLASPSPRRRGAITAMATRPAAYR